MELDAIRARSRALLRMPWSQLRETQEAAAIVYCWLFIVLACMVMMFGPALLDLSLQVNASVRDVGYCLGIRTFAYAVGSLCGPVYDRLPGHAVLAVALSIGGIGSLVIPVCRSVYALAVVVAIQGFFLCFVDAGANILLLWVFNGDPNMHPWMQALHFAFALGAFIAPLLLRVVAGVTGETAAGEVATAGTYSPAFYIMGIVALLSGALCMLLPSPKPRKDVGASADTTAASTDGAAAASAGAASVEPARLIRAADETATADAWGALVPVDGTVATGDAATGDAAAPDAAAAPPAIAPAPATASERRSLKWRIILVAALLLAGYVGAEAGFGFFATAYGVFALGMREAEGQYLTSAYWGSITLGRLLAVPVSTRASPRRMLDIVTVGCCASIVLLLLAQGNVAAAWAGAIAFGACMACVFPTIMALVESYFPILGVHATIFVVGCASGEWLLPFLISTFIGATVSPEGETIITGGGPGPAVMLYVVAAGTLWFTLAYRLLLTLGARYVAATGGNPPGAHGTKTDDATKAAGDGSSDGTTAGTAADGAVQDDP